jgi:hypothetical protein
MKQNKTPLEDAAFRGMMGFAPSPASKSFLACVFGPVAVPLALGAIFPALGATSLLVIAAVTEVVLVLGAIADAHDRNRDVQEIDGRPRLGSDASPSP